MILFFLHARSSFAPRLVAPVGELEEPRLVIHDRV